MEEGTVSKSSFLGKSPSPMKSATRGKRPLALPSDSMQNFEHFAGKCSLCLDDFAEPLITKCGHTFCKECILEHVESSKLCPICKANVTPTDLSPNHAVNDIIIYYRNLKTNYNLPRHKFLDEKGLQFLPINSLSDVNDSMSLLKKAKERLEFELEAGRKMLIKTFLEGLLQRTEERKRKLMQEINLINQDLQKTVKNSAKTENLTVENSTRTENLITDIQTPSCSYRPAPGFNTFPLTGERASLAQKKLKISQHFEELSQVYLEIRNSNHVDVNEDKFDVVPSSTISYDSLDGFSETLAHITSYTGMKSLATINADVLATATILSSVEFDKSGEFFSVAGTSGKIRIYEFDSVIGYSTDFHNPSAELNCNNKISCVAWNSYYRNQMVASDYDGGVVLWDVGKSSQIKSFNEHQSRVWSVDWCPRDPRFLASGGDDSKIRLWSTDSAAAIAVIVAPGNVCTVKFSPNGNTLACGSTDRSVLLYDIRSSKYPFAEYKGHLKSVSHVEFLNANELVSASTDNQLKTWNLSTHTEIKTFQGHINVKNFVGLATDGNFIACGSEDNSLYIYNKMLSKPLFAFKFETTTIQPKPENTSNEFVSTVAWKKDSPIVVGANSQGAIKILQLV